MERLLEILEELRRKGHRYNDDDGFYSCPLAENGWWDKPEPRKCDCALDEHNAKIDEAIAIVKSWEKLVY